MLQEIQWLIWSNEHNGWWRPGRCGYTNHKELAGKYSFEQAVAIVESANKYIQWKHMPGDNIPVPNEAMIPDTI